MKKIIKLSGVHVDNDALPIVAASESERTLASIPGLFFWLQGGYAEASGAHLDRVDGGAIVPRTSSSNWTEGALDGVPAIVTDDGWVAIYDVPEGVQFAPDRWSVVMVASVSSTATTIGELLSGQSGSGETGVLNMRLGFTSTKTLMLREGTATSRLEVPVTGWVDQAALIEVTFSVERGISVFVNGALVAVDAEDKRPLDNTAFQIGAQGGGLRSMNGFHGKLGHLMLFNSDLSSIQNSGYRRVLERTLMDKYGIS